MVDVSVVNTCICLPVLTTYTKLSRDNLVCLGKNIAWAKPEPMSICGQNTISYIFNICPDPVHSFALGLISQSASFHNVCGKLSTMTPHFRIHVLLT